MKKILAIIALGVVLSGCVPSAEVPVDMSSAVSMVPELRDCKTFKVSDGVRAMFVVRCPAAGTVSTATIEKHPVYTSNVMDSIDPNGGGQAK